MSYFTINQNSEHTLIISKSKFFAFAYHLKTEIEAEDILSSLKKAHPFSTHICFAYVLEDLRKFSDDGEPKGTAGMPILDVIQRRGLKNVMIAVVRYFGGIKLGAGGLTRAYSGACAEVLNIAGQREVKICKTACLRIDFSLSENVRLIRSAKLKNTEYSEQVKLSYLVPLENEQIFLDEINEAFRGGGHLSFEDGLVED